MKNAAALAGALVEQGFDLVSGGTDNHLMLVDLRPAGLTGKEMERRLDEVRWSPRRRRAPGRGAGPPPPDPRCGPYPRRDTPPPPGRCPQRSERRLDEVNITVNKNAIPNDPEKPFVTSGIRVGTPAATTRGFVEEEKSPSFFQR